MGLRFSGYLLSIACAFALVASSIPGSNVFAGESVERGTWCGFWVKRAAAALKLHANFAGALTYLNAPVQSISANIPGVRQTNIDALRFKDETDPQLNFFDRGLQLWGSKVIPSGAGLQAIPKRGPVILAFNHPTGFLDGLAAGSIGARVRKDDFKFIVTKGAEGFEELRPYIIAVDNMGGRNARLSNGAPLRQMLGHLNTGGAIGIFPAGEVAHPDEQPWDPITGRLIEKTGATVVPVYLSGHTTPEFVEWGEIHPRLRTFRLPWEFQQLKNVNVLAEIGSPITAAEYKAFAQDHEARMAELRSRVQLLGQIASETRPNLLKGITVERIPLSIDLVKMSAEIRALPAEAKLYEVNGTDGTYEVFAARESEMPYVMREISRLRELTFRREGEGTGKRIDLDEYDVLHATQLFIRHKETGEIVGGYRLAEGNRYLRDLFEVPESFTNEPTLELSRAWVRPEYQGKALGMLWSGIGRYLAKNPKYTRLIGMISISSEVDPVSQQLLVEFVQQNFGKSPLADKVTPKTPPQFSPENGALSRDEALKIVGQLRNFDELEAVLKARNPNGKPIPQLFPGYKLFGAKVLSVNQDAAFGNVVDVAVEVSVPQVHPRFRQRFMGDEGSEIYRQTHNLPR